MFWGERYGIVRDPFGHYWSLCTRGNSSPRTRSPTACRPGRPTGRGPGRPRDPDDFFHYGQSIPPTHEE